MRTAIAPCAAVVLPLTLVFLAAVPQETQGNPAMGILKGAVGILGPILNNYLSELRARRASESINIRVWMHNGDAKLNGCGYYIQVDGYAGGIGYTWFPKSWIHRCGEHEYEMRMTSQSAMYEKTVHLGNEQASRVELHADGWHNTFANTICIGFNERTIGGGPRAFCMNNEILKGCKSLMNKWNDIYLEWNDIMVTRSSRGAHKIIFREVEILVSGFERLGRNPDDVDAMWTLCDRIDLVKGRDRDDNWNCGATRTWTESVMGMYTGAPMMQTMYEKSDINPYGCNRFTDRL